MWRGKQKTVPLVDTPYGLVHLSPPAPQPHVRKGNQKEPSGTCVGVQTFRLEWGGGNEETREFYHQNGTRIRPISHISSYWGKQKDFCSEAHILILAGLKERRDKFHNLGLSKRGWKEAQMTVINTNPTSLLTEAAFKLLLCYRERPRKYWHHKDEPRIPPDAKEHYNTGNQTKLQGGEDFEFP